MGHFRMKMTDCGSDKEWLIHLSLSKLFKWKVEGHSLHKQVLVTNLLLGAGFPRLFLFGNPEYRLSPEKPLGYTKDHNQVDTSATIEKGNDPFSNSSDNELIIDQLLDSVRDGRRTVLRCMRDTNPVTPYKPEWHHHKLTK